MPESSGVYRIIAGRRYEFPDEEKARQWDALNQQRMQQFAEREGVASQALTALKSVIPGVVRGTGLAATGIGSLFQAEAPKEFGRGAERLADVISEEYLGVKPYQRLTTGAMLGETLGAMAPAALGTAAAAAAMPETGGLSATLIPAIVGGVIGGAQGAGEVGRDIQEARARGAQISPEQEQKLAAIQGATTAALEGLPLGRLAGEAKALATTGRLAMRKPQEEAVKEVIELLTARAPQLRARALKSAAIEGGTEATQQLIQNILARGDVSSITGPGYDPGRELLQGVVESGLVGAGFGGALQGGIDIYNKRQLNKFQSQYRAPEEQSPEIEKILEDAVLSREIAGQREEKVAAGILSEQRAKALDDTLSSAVSTLSDPEQLRQKISSELFGTEYDLLDKKQSRKVDDKLKKELPSPFQRMRAYLEIASQDQFGKLYSELSDAKADEAGKSEREVVNEIARDLFQRRADPNSLAIGIQMREREAPGAVEAKPRPPLETGEVFTGEPLEIKQARIQEYKRKKLRAQVEPILNLPIKAATSRVYLDEEGRVIEPGPSLYQKVQRQKYIPEPVVEGSLEAERAKGLPEGQLSEQGIFVEDKPPAYEPEAPQQVEYRLQPESILGQAVQATEEGVRQKQEPIKQAYEPAPPPSMEQIVEATAQIPEQIKTEEAKAAEDRQFSRYKKFDRDEYRSVLEGLKSTPDAAISSSYLAKTFGLTPPAANSMMSLMRSRGDVIESDGKFSVNPEAEGPMYKLPKGRKESVAAQVAAPVEPERGTPITRAPKMRLDVETGRKVSSQAYEQLRKLGVSDLYSLVVVDNFLDADGNIKPEGARFLNNVIGLASKVNDIAESQENLINTVNHEVVHGMRKSGFFSDAQWNLLTAKFTPQGELDEDTIAAYQSRFKNQTPERLNEILQEEAVAHAIERLGNEPERPLSLPEKTLMQKVKDLARIGTSANNLGYTAEDLISAVRAGDVGRRAIQGKPTALDAARSAKQPTPTAPIAETEEAQAAEELTEQERKAAEGESPAELRGNISDDDAMFSFVGSKAYSKDPIESARISSFKEAALQMEAIGDNPEDIRLATGWFRNPYDNMWRYEVADEDAKMTQAFKNLSETASIPLMDALHHHKLFEAYPELLDLKVSRKKDPLDFFRSTQGWFDPKTNTINITPYSKDPESTLLHEVQHWIQENEGFATGGNLEIAKQKATPGQIQAIVRAEVEEKSKDLEKTAKRIEELRKSRDFLSAHNKEMAPLIDVARQVDAAWTEFYEYARKNDDTISPKTEEGKRLKERWEGLYNIKGNMTSSVANSIASRLGDSNYRLISPIIDAMSFKAQELTDRESDFVKTQKEIAELSSGDQEVISKLVEKRAFDLYRNIAGEIESRDVQARKEYTPEKRRETKPLTSENIPRSEALVIKGTPSSEISKETKESPEEQAMFKLPKQQAPKLFKVKEEKSLLDVVKSNPVAQIPAAIRDAVIDRPSVRAVIGPGSSLGKVLGLRQYWLQADAPSAKLQEKLYWEKGDEKYTNTATSAISAIRQSQKFNELLSAMLNKGYAYFDKSTGFFTVKEDARYAIMPQFKKLAAKGKLYQAWDAAIAQRFVDVENSGRDAKALLGGTFTLKQAQDTVDQYKNDADIQEFLEVYRNFNNALIDLNRYVGNYDAATAAKLKAWFYSPYYRVPVDESGYLEAPSVSVSRITNLQSAKAISGRELDINDAIENFITNAQYMVGYAMKSEGARRAIRDAVDGKLATKLEGKDDKGNLISSPRFATDKSRVVRVNENGKKVYYEIHDQLLYNSLNNSQVRLASLAVLGKGFSNWLRTGVTSAPTFMLNNMFLDAFRLWGLGIYQDNLFKSIAGNIVSGIQSVRKEDDAYQTLVRAGLIGNMKLSRDSVQAAMEIRRQLAIEQGNAFVNLLRQIKNYTLGTAEAFSAKSEAVNRVQVYRNVKKDMAKRGLSPEAAESAALFAAMEYPVNFDVRGNGEIAQYAAALFPFVNASAQGTDVFYRNIRAMAQTRGVMLGGKKQRTPVNQLQAAALDASKRVLVSSMIYGTLYTFLLAASDNKAWKKATPDERNTNLFLPLPNGNTFNIPVPPEMGLVALAIPNAFAEAIYGQDNGKQILKHLASYFANLFTFSPVPQIARPALEVAVNKNFFTWRPIENMAQQKLSPEYRYDETTTGVGRGLGVAAEKLSMPISPVQFDHLIRGYLGTSGIFVSDLIGQLFGSALNKNDPERFRPLTDPYLLPGIGKKFAAPTDRKAIDDYYQIRNFATQAANNLKAIDAAKVYETEPEKLRSMAYWSQINKALEAGPEKRMEELRKLKSQVQSAPANVLTPAQKTDMLKQINLKMNEVARGVQHLKRHLPFTWF